MGRVSSLALAPFVFVVVGMALVLIDNVTATLQLLREHEARLESRLSPLSASHNRR